MGAVAMAAVVALWWVGAVAVAVMATTAVAVAVMRVSTPFPCASVLVLLLIPFFKSSN